VESQFTARQPRGNQRSSVWRTARRLNDDLVSARLDDSIGYRDRQFHVRCRLGKAELEARVVTELPQAYGHGERHDMLRLLRAAQPADIGLRFLVVSENRFARSFILAVLEDRWAQLQRHTHRRLSGARELQFDAYFKLRGGLVGRSTDMDTLEHIRRGSRALRTEVEQQQTLELLPGKIRDENESAAGVLHVVDIRLHVFDVGRTRKST